MFSLRRALAAGAGVAIAAAGLQILSLPSAQASSAPYTNLLISEVYGGDGSGSATYHHDFVELFNPTSAPITFAANTLYISYFSATSTSSTPVAIPAATVPAYTHFMIERSTAGSGANPVNQNVPHADATIALPDIAGAGGRVYLQDTATAQTTAGDLTSNAHIIDAISGNASGTLAYEGTSVGTVGGGATTSLQRKDDPTHGYLDTNTTASDLKAAAPTPKSTQDGPLSLGGTSSLALAAPGPQSVTAGSAFSLQLNPTGGTSPYTYSVDGGAAAAGLTVSATGLITGTPSTSGVYSVSAHVSDSATTPATVSQTFTLTVTAASGTGAPASPHPLISEVYTDGGYTGASFLNDFIELYNPSTSSVDLSNYSIGYGADLRGTGTYPLALTSTQLSGSIPAHGHYLIQAHQDTKAIGAALPTPDFTWTSAPDFFYAAGLIVLSDQPTPPIPSIGNIANTAHIVDALGYGADANTFETARQGTDLGATTSANRTVPGTDTDNNAADFSVNSPTPTNAAGESAGSVTTGGTCTSPTPAIADIQGTNTDTSPYAGCSVTVQGIVTADYPTGGLNGFTVQTAGTGGTTDATPGASDAVFVYGSTSAAAVTVGESVSVTGTVQEFAGETEIVSPTVTQVTPSLAAVTPAHLAWSDLDTDAKREAHESELIAPQGDYTVTDNYDVNYYGTIVLAADSDKPLNDPTDVATPGSAQAQATAAYNATHTITLDDGSSWNYSTSTHTGDPLPWLTATHSVTIGAAATFGSAGVVLDFRNSEWNFQPTHQVTDTGTDVATFTDMRGTVNAAPENVGGDIKLATFNMENFFAETGDQFVADGLGTCSFYKDRAGNEITDNTCTFNAAHAATVGSAGPRGAATTTSFNRQLAKEVYGVNHLGASIVSLEEVENSAKYGEDRDHALSVFVDALNAATAPGTWAYIPTGALTQPGIIDQDVIRSAFIYKPADVSPVGAATILSNDSAAGQPFSIAREPLAQEFKGAGQPDSNGFLVVSNHFKSKGADANGLFNDCGTGKGDAENTDPASDQGGFNCTRVHQANDMSTWAEGLAATDGIAPIFMLGDFNAYTHEDPMEALYAKGYHDLQTTENGPDAKATYSYGGLEGSLDHVLGNDAALAMVSGADVWQIDGQEPVAYVYSRYNYNVTQLFSADNPFAISDHDPEIVGINLPSVAPSKVTATGTVKTSGGAGIGGVCVYLYTSTTAPSASYASCTAADGTFSIGDVTPGDYTVAVSDPSGHYQTYWSPSLVTVGTGSAPIQVTLAGQTTGTVSGVVSDASGPVSGACVYLYDASTSTSTYATCTGADGSYWIQVSDTTKSYKLAVADPTGAHVTQWWTGTAGGAATIGGATALPLSGGAALTENVTLAPASNGSVAGTVTGTGGTPVGGACVYLYKVGDTAAASYATCAQADGTYWIGGIAAGGYQVAFFDPSATYATQWWTGTAGGAAAQSGAATVTVGHAPVTGTDAHLTPVP